MHRLLLLFLLLVPGSLLGAEETHAPSGQIEIFADQFEFDSTNHTAVYTGHVRVLDPQMKLVCERLTAELTEVGGTNARTTINQIVAQGSVQVDMTTDQGSASAYGDKAVYEAATDTVELTGKPRLVTRQGTLTGDRVIVDRRRNRLEARGNVRMVMPAEALKQPGFSLNKDKPALKKP